MNLEIKIILNEGKTTNGLKVNRFSITIYNNIPKLSILFCNLIYL